MRNYNQNYTIKKSNYVSRFAEVLVVLLIFASAFLWLFL